MFYYVSYTTECNKNYFTGVLEKVSYQPPTEPRKSVLHIVINPLL